MASRLAKIMHRSSTKADEIAALGDDFDVYRILLNMSSPPLEIVQAFVRRLQDRNADKRFTPSALPSSFYRSIGLDGDLCAVFPSAPTDTFETSNSLAEEMFATLCLVCNYVDYVQDALTKIMIYESQHSTSAMMLNAASDADRLRRYAVDREDLDHFREEIDSVCNMVGTWWVANPKAMCLATSSAVQILVKLSTFVSHIEPDLSTVLYELYKRNKTELSHRAAIALTSHILFANQFLLSSEKSSDLFAYMLLKTEAQSDATLLMLVRLHQLILELPAQARSTRLGGYSIERIAMRVMGDDTTTKEHITWCVCILATFSGQNPRRRVLNMTHQCITGVLDKLPTEEIMNPLRRLITASTTNRRDFHSYDKCLGEEDRKKWWRSLGLVNVPIVTTQEALMDGITDHPIISESAIYFSRDKPVRLETVLHDVNEETVKDCYTNETMSWDEFIASSNKVAAMETYD